MDNFFLNLNIEESENKLKHGDDFILLGSCFSDEISNKLKFAGHQVFSNPFGTIFHPTALAYSIFSLFEDLEQNDIFQRDNQYYYWLASTKISSSSQEGLIETISEIKNNFKSKLQQAKILIVTFGTAWGYELAESQKIVANCHKMPSNLFNKFLSSPYEIVQDWRLVIDKIQTLNPDIEIVFTVSPVRHIRDGIIENNLSKARLIEAVSQLSYEFNAQYFPSYELIIDVLRDYRFYKADLVHPNDEAINYIWKKFEQTYFDETTTNLNRKVESVNAFGNHQSTKKEEHQQKFTELKQNLSNLHPQITWYK
ncbi:MAG TPA: GSCFA domain-containing protein [Taishania sp.]|nr:GSCFA domain-containing protein [Taishania sp.]